MNERWASRLSLLIFVVGVIWLAERVASLLQGFGDILLLFFLAWLVAFVLDPLVVMLQRLHLPRALAATFVYAALLISLALIGILIGPVVVDQLLQLRDSLPQVIALLPSEEQLHDFFVSFGLPVPDLSIIYRPEVLAQRLQTSAGSILQGALMVATSAITVIVNLFLMLIISYYMLLDGHRLLWDVMRVTPAHYRREALIFLNQLSSSFGGFLRGQIIQAVLFGLVVAAMMAALGLSFIAVSAVTSAVLMLIPLLGPLLALMPVAVAATFEPTPVLVSVVIALILVQFVLINVLMPRILSTQIGMPALLVFLAILLGLRIGGPIGAFFGIPIMGVIYGTARVIFKRWRAARLAERRQRAAGSDG